MTNTSDILADMADTDSDLQTQENRLTREIARLRSQILAAERALVDTTRAIRAAPESAAAASRLVDAQLQEALEDALAVEPQATYDPGN
jgi:predicted  nucleic acid-binding Zn-ribbon protein